MRIPKPGTVISFDCYGTLIDRESGIAGCLREVAAGHGIALADQAILSTYSEVEPRIQAGPYQPYREILRAVVAAFGERHGFAPTQADLDALPDSLRNWRPFPDTVQALRKMKARYQLAIVSNIDRDLFAASARWLEVPFDWVITAEDVRSYKPGEAHFTELLRQTGLPREQHLHAAESLFHDIAPTRALGIPNVWVKRSHGEGRATASRLSAVSPDWTVGSLAELAALVTGG